MPYIDATTLTNALGPTAFMAIFDDNNDGVLDDAAVTLTIARAHARVTSQLLSERITPPAELPAAVDPLLTSVELDYAIGYAIERHPEYARTGGGGKPTAQESRADATMRAIVSARAQLQQSPTEGPPKNVGGATLDMSHRVALDNVDGTRNTGDF